ncbi:penicillin acylase family protein [Pseudoteredinibacter isoporae]|uniref:Acyl-homoserine-lactone acylase n=1 Tax=Pseudoteredinibacter isoporae TaxID=570281 RepID=A0A7X0JVD1_9GAMM|nr:penicillin acylase family protein [Pseudoteredinibacter isoporae]MBB6522494.1 acyl-homoserine-lactone acylase [Pseudoteredinibacter isoporae]NHO88023.1 acyl-homoserine-lactone acylase [Pseudoteredinibacter isoporae]NIB23646.1 acyl-homoserine-lactone acylase [Pseudoteredinibacter isoporae]
MPKRLISTIANLPKRSTMKTALIPVSILGFACLSACSPSSETNKETAKDTTAATPAKAEQFDYSADVHLDKYGVPHIVAKDYSSLGYATGYMQARENLCTLAEQIRNVRGESARYLGAGPKHKYVLSDIAYHSLNLVQRAQQLYPQLDPAMQDLLRGYTDGFNNNLAERNSPEEYPSPCRGADWVSPVKVEELLAYHMDLAMLSSSRAFIPAIASAKPPKAPKTEEGIAGGEEKVAFHNPELNAEHVFTSKGIGSNGWALGKDKVSGANSLLMANPHFPYDGELRFYQQHLTIPGELNIAGVGMIGLPGVSIGFNENLGWTHTVSQSKRFTLYQLELDPNNPMRYRYGDDYRDIVSHTVTVDVKQGDGQVQTQEHKVYGSHFGPIVNLASLSPNLGWNPKSAISLRDANLDNTGMLSHWVAMAKASSPEEFLKAFEDHRSIPWVNTMMAAKDGRVLYIDGTQTPKLSEQAEGYWRKASQSPKLAGIWRDGAGAILLPGNDPAYEWQATEGARQSGLMPINEAPKALRSDYVFNANSSHWLSHLEEPLEGFSIVYGPEKTHRSPRTRFNALLISNRSAKKPAGDDNLFDIEELKAVFTGNESLFGQQLLADLVARCQAAPQQNIGEESYDLSAACQALANWDGRYLLESRGAHLMREFLAEFRVPGHRDLSDKLFANAFDPAKPAMTPGALAPAGEEQDHILLALARAAKRLDDNGVAPDAKLGDIQYIAKAKGLAPIPVTGAYSWEGIFNYSQGRTRNRGLSELALADVGTPASKQPFSPLRKRQTENGSEAAYPVNYGSSFVMALQFTEQGPQGDMFLSYGQSHDPQSPHFVDQSKMFSQQQWRPIELLGENLPSVEFKLRANKPEA